VYCENVHDWLRQTGRESIQASAHPFAVIRWFHTLIHSKIARAVHGAATDDDRDRRDWPADHDGSAKVALIGIERSHEAWLQAVERGTASDGIIEIFLADLEWLAEELEREFPNARTFVRPGFDEPDEVARLLASETSP
jgi:hypothetical protein